VRCDPGDPARYDLFAGCELGDPDRYRRNGSQTTSRVIGMIVEMEGTREAQLFTPQ